MVKKHSRPTATGVFDRLMSMTVNTVLSRSSLLPFGQGRRGLSLDVTPNRNIDDECGYITGEPTLSQYRMMYDQEGTATRIVDAFADECWIYYPDLYEEEGDSITRFERKWKEIEENFDPWYYLHRLDQVSGIGHYGILLIGLDDKADLSQPAPGFTYKAENPAKRPEKGPNLLYFQTFSEDLVRIVEKDTDPRSARCGLPVMYEISMGNIDRDASEAETGTVLPQVTNAVRVHWSRVIHFSGNCKTSEVYGVPLLRNLHRRVYDVRKILGSSAEMLYKGGFPGLAFETLPELVESGVVDLKSVKKEIDSYSEGLQRYLRLIGMTVKNLTSQVEDPQSYLFEQYTYICLTIGMPIPVFLGQMEGHAAGLQNMEYWRTRVRRRQNLILTSRLIRPLTKRFIALGILPKPKNDAFTVSWRDVGTLSDKDKADIALKKAQALLQFVTSGSWKAFPIKMFYTLVMQMSDDEADAVIKAGGGEEKIMAGLEKMIDMQAGNTPASTGTDPAASTGANGRSNGLGRGAKNKTRTRRSRATGNG